jgi:hypothetical protein
VTSNFRCSSPQKAGAGRQVIAPYITAWSAERDPLAVLVERPGGGIAYQDESLADRDSNGSYGSAHRFDPVRADQSSAGYTPYGSDERCNDCCAKCAQAQPTPPRTACCGYSRTNVKTGHRGRTAWE